jgi:hypothetical protein
MLAQNTAVSDALLQYGAVGILAAVALYIASVLFKQQTVARQREVIRADKAEEQLIELNKIIREQLVVQLTRATDSISKVTEMLDRYYRGDRRDI